ncbi:MAG: hypothetical protein JWR26_1889 [Pedosphaera sp.]|nr:hypothetical protein [Pedosphaera sp.]
MKLARFRIQNYKCILDSEWVNVSGLTVLVGKNEAGKTSLLKALHKFNPFKPEPYSISREWPRGFRGQRADSQVVCTAEFELAADEIKALQELTTSQLPIERIQVTRDYSGRIEVLFPEGMFTENLHPNEMDSLCAELPEPSPGLSDDFRKAAMGCRKEALRLAHEGRFAELTRLLEQQIAKLSVSSSHPPEPQHEQDFRNSFLAKLSQLAAALAKPRTSRQKAHEYVIHNLPAFVYMDEYQTFSGTAQLDEVRARKERQHLKPEDETFLAILSLAELDFEKECRRGRSMDEQTREERQYDLGDGEATLNRKIQDHWGQMRFQVEFRIDENRFMTFVKGALDKALIRLEERSKGFQWFFSFDLMLMHETRGKLKGCVILLDEPGLHLHPEGQRDLLNRLTDYARDNTLIYSTHLPFMIDLQEPERIRVISETDKGSVVAEDLTQAQPAAKVVLHAALALQGQATWLASEQNLVVQDADQYWILTELSNLFRRSSRDGLPPELLLTSAGGASELTLLATFMAGERMDVLALFDNDPAGRAARQKLEKGWLPRYNGHKASTLDLAIAAGVSGRECCVEDLFPEDFYTIRVQQVHEKQLLAAGLTALPLPLGNLLAKRAETALKAANVIFNRRAVCKRIAADIRKMPKVHELPEQTRRMAEGLFQAITKALNR